MLVYEMMFRHMCSSFCLSLVGKPQKWLLKGLVAWKSLKLSQSDNSNCNSELPPYQDVILFYLLFLSVVGVYCFSLEAAADSGGK